MKPRHSKNEVNRAPMHAVIGKMISELAPVINRDSDEVISEVYKDLQQENKESKLVSILTNLVNAIIAGNDDPSSVRVNGHRHRDLILLHVSHNGPFNFSGVSDSLGLVQALAQKMNGYIGVTTYLNNITTIAFSFTNMLKQ